ncbi:MAG TPA: EAL domain-containing protein [Burkholderiaceae bacterium]|jgi:EAL domain-containing protein (putative c-di-GMP-specific phosphodiesterase class I)|nr:EAL domain-containing protein [Burkholderiaceae bacterium]
MTQPHAALVRSARFQHYLEGLPSRYKADAARPLWRDASGRVQAQFLQCALTSEFAPVVHVQTGAAFAHEGRIRTYAEDDEGLSAWRLFARAADDATLIALDRMCRLVHAINYFQGDDTVPLIVGIHDRLLAAVLEDHGAAYRNVLVALGLPQDFVWIQIPANANRELSLLLQVVRNYRRNGFHLVVQADDLATARMLLAQARPAVLSIDWRTPWPAGDLDALRTACEAQGVQLLARHVQTPQDAAHVTEAGIRLAQGEAVRPRWHMSQTSEGGVAMPQLFATAESATTLWERA